MASSLASWQRWWIYQAERFPVVKHGLLIAVFSLSTVGYSSLLRGSGQWPTVASSGVAFISLFCCFLQMRIADEFKDIEADRRYRPYRPVPRGLVSLRELGWLGVGTALLQLGAAVWLQPQLVPWLGVIWLYFGLMGQEFFVAAWLRRHLLAYMLSHLVYLPLITLYATACDWLVMGHAFPVRLGWFLAASFCNGAVIELGRKIRAPEDEEVGVETYTAFWGRRSAVVTWGVAMTMGGGLAMVAAAQVQAGAMVGAISVLLWCVAMTIGWQFLRRPTRAAAKRIDQLSGLWTLGIYLSLGILPWQVFI